MITYKTNDKFPGVNFPVLHQVRYAETVDHVDAFYQRSYLEHKIDAWLLANCRHKYYHSPGYLREKFIQFECNEEALMFALKWSR
jgi:hypothetical protein